MSPYFVSTFFDELLSRNIVQQEVKSDWDVVHETATGSKFVPEAPELAWDQSNIKRKYIQLASGCTKVKV
jgi:hypothetical protein